jgi:peptidoglycan DL-endopeptidase LytF
MSRRDTILVAVLINAGLLALLFMIAINPDEERGFDKAPLIVEAPEIQEKVELAAPAALVEVEMDKVLQEVAEPPVQADQKKTDEKQHVTITVKRGDMLERIARANGTTVQRLKQLNQLQDERIEIGQLLRVPVSSTKEEEVPRKEENEEFYTIKNGDNPWKIAKQFNVRFDDLLQLNQLDEEKARKLKAGDKIRVH